MQSYTNKDKNKIMCFFFFFNTSVGIRAQNCILGLRLWLKTLIGPMTNKQ